MGMISVVSSFSFVSVMLDIFSHEKLITSSFFFLKNRAPPQVNASVLLCIKVFRECNIL